MAKRSVLIFIVSLLLLLAISLWFYTARIASSLIPPLVNSESLQIDTLNISSIGWRQASIARFSGTAEINSGLIYFDIRDASINYKLSRLQPDLVKVKQAEIEFKDFGGSTSPVPTTSPVLVVPTQVTIEELSVYVEGSPVQFRGSFDLQDSKGGFSVFAQDDNVQLEVLGDTTLSNLEVKMKQNQGVEIAQMKAKLENMDLTNVHVTAALDPLHTWLKGTQFLPADYQYLLDELDTAVGHIEVSANHTKDNDWQAEIKIDASSIKTEPFYGSVVLGGDLRSASNGWNFTFTQPGTLRIHLPGYQLNEISTIDIGLPNGYVVSQTLVDQQTITLSSNGRADFTLHRTDDTELSANLTAWQLGNWKDIVVDVENLTVVSPYALNAQSFKSEMQLTNIAPLLMRGNVNVSAVRTDDLPKDLPGFNLEGEWNWNDGAFDITGSVDWNELTRIASGSFINKVNSGALHIEVDQPVAELFQPLQGFLKQQNWDISFSDGSIKARMDWAWDEEFYDNKLEMTATGVNGRLLGLHLRDGSIKVNSTDLVALSLQVESTIAEVTLANDVDVTDLTLGGRWQNGFYVDHAELSIFGGTVKMDPVFLDFSGKPNIIELEVDNIELDQVLQMIGQEGLSGSGRMGGNIPLRLLSDGIAIDDGYLKNKTKGTLSYNFSGESAPQLDNIALQALNDFRYDTLDIELNYQTNGDYTIRSRLEGRNPQLYEGYPIAFNINLTGSLPGLLRASLITGDFHSEILKQIQREQQ